MTDYVATSGETLTGLSLSSQPLYVDTYYYEGQTPDTADIQSGGVLTNSSLGTFSSSTVDAGGSASSLTLDGGKLIVATGGAISNTTVEKFYTTYYGSPSINPYTPAMDLLGNASSTTITGGNVIVEVGGHADGIVVASASNQTANYGTVFYGLTVDGSASQVVVSSGSAIIASGGAVSDASTGSGGTLSISAGGSLVASSAINNSGLITNAGTIVVQNQNNNVVVGASVAATFTVNSGGTLSNAGSLSISGGLGGGGLTFATAGGSLDAASGAAITNTGTISAYGGGGGNRSGGGGGGGVIALSTGATLTNQGLISLAAGGASSMAPPGLGGALLVASGSTFVNAGTLNVASPFTTTYYNVETFTGGGGSASVMGTLVLDPGQVTNGVVQGTSGAVLELASGGNATLSGLGSTYAGFGTVQVDPNANITFTGSDALADGATIQLGNGSTVTNDLLTIPTSGTINFQGASTLDINEGLNNATITGFNTADHINLLDLSPGSYIVTGSGNNITVETSYNSQFNSQEQFTFAGETGRHYALTALPSSSPTGFPNQQPVSYALTLEPAATAIVAHADSVGTLSVGNVVTFDLTPEVPVSFNASTGLPTLTLNDGGVAALDEVASTSTNLVFRTTIAGGQSTSDLKVTGLSLGGGTLTDQIGTTFDTLSVPLLTGSNTGIVVGSSTVTLPTTVTGGVTVIGGAGGTVFITPKAGSNSVTATATGNDTVISQGTDTIQAGGGADVVYATGAAATVVGGTGSLTFEGATGNDMVVGGSGSSAIYGGSGSDTFFGGTGSSILVAGSGAGNMLLAGLGNTSLVGGLGKAVMMFGGPGVDSFTGSSGGNDIMVGGAGGNSFSLTNGDVAFGGPIKADTFTAGNGTAMITTGAGGAQVYLGSGTLTSFEGSGAVDYNAGKGEGGTTDIVGFTSHDHITLTGGFTAQDASTAFATATKGSFGTTLNLTDGTKITVFGVNLTTTQVGVTP